MPAEINWKSKYMELRSKYMGDLDMSFRLGYEQGAQQSQQDQFAQSQQKDHEMNMASMQSQNNQQGQESEDQGQSDQESPSEHPEGSELDQHIARLEDLVSKSEPLSSTDLRKSIEDLKGLKKSWNDKNELAKSQSAIKSISKALHKPAFKMSQQANINLSENAKQAVSMQHKIVSDVLNKMEQEEKRASGDIQALLKDIVKE